MKARLTIPIYLLLGVALTGAGLAAMAFMAQSLTQNDYVGAILALGASVAAFRAAVDLLRLLAFLTQGE